MARQGIARPLEGAVLYEDFKAVVREACEQSTGAAGGLIAIPELRRALRDRAKPEEFDRFLLDLQREGLVHLLTHIDPDRLSATERADALQHPSGVLAYWVCWL